MNLLARFTRPISRLVLSLLYLASSGAWAQSDGFACVIVGRSGQTVRSAAGATIDAPARLANCEGATIIGDGLQVCFVNERRERRCKDFKKGSTVTRAALGASESSGLAETVIAMAKGDTRALAGQTRNNTRADGLPYGQVLGAGGSVGYDLTLDPRVQQAQNLRLTTDSDNGAVLWESASPASQGRIALQSLKPDTWYRWVADAGGRRLSGRFLLLGPAAEATRKHWQDLQADTVLSPEARLYLEAELFHEAGLAHERMIAVNAMRRLTAAP